MGWFSDTPKLNRTSWLLLSIDFGFAFAISLSNIFLSVYLWRLSESLIVNGSYHVFLFAFVAVGFWVGGWLSKKKDSLLVFRLGVAVMALFFFAVLVIREGVSDYAVLFGAVNGMAQGFYWVSMLVLVYDRTNNDNRLHYFGWQMAVMAAAQIGGPLLSGFVIGGFNGLTGYVVVFGFSFVLFVLITLASFFIEKETSRSKTYFVSFIFKRMLKQMTWKKVYLGWFGIGLREGMTLFLPPILLYHFVRDESVIGVLTVLFGVAKMASGQLLGRLGRRHHYARYALAGAIGLTLCSLPLLFHASLWTVVLFFVGNAFFGPPIRMSQTSRMYQLISELPSQGKKLKTELIAVRQLFLILGRVFSVGWVLLLVRGVDVSLIAWLLLFASLTQFLLYFAIKEKNVGWQGDRLNVNKHSA